MKSHAHQPNPRYTPHLLLGIVLLITVGGCSSLQIASRWKDDAIRVDGKNDDWAGKTELIQAKKLTVGFSNDSDFVYVMLSTTDRATSRMLMTQGLTVWFDTAGGRTKVFGIHYPLGLFGSRSGRGRDEQGDPFGAFRGNTSLSEMEILGPGSDDVHRVPVSSADGILARGSASESGFVYELKVPYTSNERQSYSIHARTGSLLGIGFLTPEMSAAESGSGESSAGTGGGRGRGGRGGGGSSMGSTPDRVQSSVEPLREWMTVQLVAPDSAKLH